MKLVLVLVVMCLVGAALSKSTRNKRALGQAKKRGELKKLLEHLLDSNDNRNTGNRRGVKKVNAVRNHHKRDDDDDDWEWDGCAKADTGLKDLLTNYISATVQEPNLDDITNQLSAKKKRRRMQRKRRSANKRDDEWWEDDDWFDWDLLDDNFYCLSDRFYLMIHLQKNVNGVVCSDTLSPSSSMFDDLLEKIYDYETFTTLDVVEALKDLIDQNSGEDFFCVMEYGWDEIWDAIWPWEWK